MEDALRRMAQEIANANPDITNTVLLGILSRGRPIADRLAALISAMTGVAPRVGSLATTLYRDDIRAGRRIKFGPGETHFDFSVDDVTVVLVDDVISAGRTIRAALDEVMDYGRPRRIQLACLVDRGLRELPIQPDYLGWQMGSQPHEHVRVRVKEVDDEDCVLLERWPAGGPQGAASPDGGK